MGRRGLDLRRECTEAATTQSVRSAIRNPKKLGDGGVSTVEEEIRCKGGPSSPTTAWRRLSTAGLREFRSGEDISRALGGGGWALVGVLTVVGLGVVGVLASSPGFGVGGQGLDVWGRGRGLGNDTGPSTGMQHHGSSTGTMNQMREMIEDAMWERYQSYPWYRAT
ncbi:hypothetical protein TIFTF001_005094 [Ficus carica]|uniref:Uncharacterized protein n=1 Tax=Ficus carica TaxID=3494 RepID=A0AA88CX34_FICCA|nr:hypothetical protein TIFTF001_005094 [Ficus carica]